MTVGSAFDRGFWGDFLARGARQAGDHLAGNAQVEAQDPAAEQSRRTGPSWRNGSAPRSPAASPSGRATVSPDWKFRSQRRRPTQVADASCGFNVGTPASKAFNSLRLGVGAGTDQQRQVGHLVDRNAVEDDALAVDQGEPLLVLPQCRGLALDDVDHQCVGQPARHARVLDPAELEQPLADRATSTRGMRLADLWSKAIA